MTTCSAKSNDVLYGGDGDDVLVGFTASNEAKQTLAAGETDGDWLYGGAGKDFLLGGEGSDYVDGGAGADQMQGGAGNDIYIVNSVNDSIAEEAGAGYDTVISSSNYLLNQNIEELRLLDGLVIHGTGNALNNKIIGNNAGNILDGVTGADTLIGAEGNDTYYVDNVGDQIIELAGEGVDRVQSTISLALDANTEDLVLLDFSKPESGKVDNTEVLVYGYPKMNELDYNQGEVKGVLGTCALTAIANILTQAGKPTTEGDVVRLAFDNNWALEDPNLPKFKLGGTTIAKQQEILTTLGLRNDLLMGYNGQGLANLMMSGRGVILGVNAGKLWGDSTYTGDGAVNHAITLTGVAYNNSDTADKGKLMGFYIADSGRHKVSDMTRFVPIGQFKAAANVAGAYFIYTLEPVKLWDEDINGTGNNSNNVIIGNRGDNTLSGWGGDDSLSGGAGNDTLLGNTGADKMNGGTGNDTYIVDQAGDTVVESSNIPAEIDRVVSSISFTLPSNVENLTLAGTAAINATGNALDNVLTGNAAANTLKGGVGADMLIGGSGNDVYVVDNAADIVSETSTVKSEIDQVESSVSHTLKANVENLTLTGSAPINGTGNSLANVILGNAANNLLVGFEGNDTLMGGAGNDILNGVTGKDVLTGGPGVDAFRFSIMPARGDEDGVTDFSVGEDSIQLENAVFTQLFITGQLNPAYFVKSDVALDLDDYVIYNPGTGALMYDADGNNTGATVLIAVLGTNLALTNADIVVI